MTPPAPLFLDISGLLVCWHFGNFFLTACAPSHFLSIYSQLTVLFLFAPTFSISIDTPGVFISLII